MRESPQNERRKSDSRRRIDGPFQKSTLKKAGAVRAPSDVERRLLCPPVQRQLNPAGY
jgi:hypothetical protein